MDFLNNHKEITNSEFENIKLFIIENLKKEFNKGIKANVAISKVAKLIENKYIFPGIIYRYNGYFEHMYYNFSHHNTIYDFEKCDTIKSVLSNEVFEEFNEKIYQENSPPELFKNMTFEKFYPELLKYYVYKRCCSRLENSVPIIQDTLCLFYDTNNYDSFAVSLLSDDLDKITVDRIQKIFKKYDKVLTLKKGESNENTFKNKVPKKFEPIDPDFSIDEKAILLHILFNSKTEIWVPEKIKIYLMCQGINDFSIFYESSNKNTLYAKVNKGIDYYKDNNKKKKQLIENILSKLEKIDVIKIKEELRSIKSRIH